MATQKVRITVKAVDAEFTAVAHKHVKDDMWEAVLVDGTPLENRNASRDRAVWQVVDTLNKELGANAYELVNEEYGGLAAEKMRLCADDKILRRTTWAVVGLTSVALALIAIFVVWTLYKLPADQAAVLSMRWYVLSIIATAGTVTLGAVFVKMKRGIRQQNLRAIGVVLVAILVTLLAVASSNYEPAFTVLGAVAGYLFGKDTDAKQ